MDRFEGQTRFESMGVQIGGQSGRIGPGGLGNTREPVRGDGESAAGKKFGQFRCGMDRRGAFDFSRGVEGGKNITPTGIGKNSQEGGLGKLPGEGAGAAHRQDGAVPDGGHAFGGSDGGADPGKRTRSHPNQDLIRAGRIAKDFAERGDQVGSHGSGKFSRSEDFSLSAQDPGGRAVGGFQN